MLDGRDGSRDDVSTTTHPDISPVKGFDVAVTIKPLEDRILVQPLEAEQTTASGLVIPDTAKEKPQEGKVLATGPGRIDDNGKRVPLDVSEGDVVIFSKYGGTEVKYDGKATAPQCPRHPRSRHQVRGSAPMARSLSSTRRHAVRSSAAWTPSPTP